MISKIDNSQLLAQLRQMAQQVDQGIRPNGTIEAIGKSQLGEGANGDFSSLLANSINRVNQMQKSSSDITKRFEMGDPEVTLPEVMMTKAKAGIAFDGMMQIRNKMVEAYQEMMRMQV
ncbi:flagellar hook-basal body complex protein FliE [Ectothiorhodospiraceae bacterium BW-2]|nr:flagellar hook-basal body complex protein FliE [Ectothiorhodospiraceae bacterium BW-2]